MSSAHGRFVVDMEQRCAEVVKAVVALCPWMDGNDGVVLRRVCAVHFGLVCGEVVDLDVMARDVLVLAARAEEVGDRLRHWAFEQWYAWACAALRGEEYAWPDLPAELAALP